MSPGFDRSNIPGFNRSSNVWQIFSNQTDGRPVTLAEAFARDNPSQGGSGARSGDSSSSSSDSSCSSEESSSFGTYLVRELVILMSSSPQDSHQDSQHVVDQEVHQEGSHKDSPQVVDHDLELSTDEASFENDKPADALGPVRNISWISECLRNKRPSIISLGSELAGDYSKYVGFKEQSWKVEGVALEDSIATIPFDLCFMMYSIALRKLSIRPHFNAFQREILCSFAVGP